MAQSEAIIKMTTQTAAMQMQMHFPENILSFSSSSILKNFTQIINRFFFIIILYLQSIKFKNNSMEGKIDKLE